MWVIGKLPPPTKTDKTRPWLWHGATSKVVYCNMKKGSGCGYTYKTPRLAWILKAVRIHKESVNHILPGNYSVASRNIICNNPNPVTGLQQVLELLCINQSILNNACNARNTAHGVGKDRRLTHAQVAAQPTWCSRGDACKRTWSVLCPSTCGTHGAGEPLNHHTSRAPPQHGSKHSGGRVRSGPVAFGNFCSCVNICSCWSCHWSRNWCLANICSPVVVLAED